MPKCTKSNVKFYNLEAEPVTPYWEKLRRPFPDLTPPRS